MYRKRLVAVALGAALAVAMPTLAATQAAAAVPIASQAKSAQDEPLRMAIVGDSFASGVGAGDYYEDTIGSCWRSRNGTGEVLARWISESGEVILANTSCSGATAEEVQQKQLGALRSDTLAVFLTAGGNDIELPAVVKQCLMPNTTCAGAPIAGALAKLPKAANNMLKLLREIGQRSPMAKIVVVGYGQPMAAGPNAPGTPGVDLDPICDPAAYLSLEERKQGSLLSAALDSTLRVTVELAKRYGVDAYYVSPYKPWSQTLKPAFAGRSVCDTVMSRQFYNGLASGDPAGSDAVLHGNGAGYEAMASLAATELPGTRRALMGLI